jgi:hypothetical protein
MLHSIQLQIKLRIYKSCFTNIWYDFFSCSKNHCSKFFGTNKNLFAFSTLKLRKIDENRIRWFLVWLVFFVYLRRCPRWLLSCIPWFPLLANVAEQYLHLYGFSPVWILIWSLSGWFALKPLPQISHLNLLSSLDVCWDSICKFNFDRA